MSLGFDIFQDETANQIEGAEKALQKKYNDKFFVDTIGGRWGTGTDIFYRCTCHSESHPDIKFEATFVKDEYTLFEDDYANVISIKNAEKYIFEKVVSKYDSTGKVFIDCRGKKLDGSKVLYLPEEFFSYQIDVYIELFVSESTLNNKNSICEEIKKIIPEETNYAAVLFYVADDNIKIEFERLRKNNIEFEHNFEEITDKCYCIVETIKETEQ